MKIINRFWLKITALTALTLVTVVGVYSFWPTKTKPAIDSEHATHLQQKVKRAPKIARHEGVYLKNTGASKFQGELSKLDQEQNYLIDPEIELLLSDNPQTRNGNQRLSKLPRRYFVQPPRIADNEKLIKPPTELLQTEQFESRTKPRSIRNLRRLRSKKPVERRHILGPPVSTELKISEEQMKKLNGKTLQHILDEYKDNPEQAEQIREILLERFKHFQEQSDTVDKEVSEEK